MTQRFIIAGKQGAWRILSPLGETLTTRRGEEYRFYHHWQALAFCEAFEISAVTRAEG